MARISTPCILVCLIDPDTGLCEGCGRTREEVTQWVRYSEEERLGIMDGLEDRMRRAFLGEPDEAASSPGRSGVR